MNALLSKGIAIMNFRGSFVGVLVDYGGVLVACGRVVAASA